MVAKSPSVDKAKILKSLKSESMQTHYVYDGFGRNTYIIQAVTGSADGGPALVTKFAFADDDATSPSGSVEYVGQWDAAWEITEDAP